MFLLDKPYVSDLLKKTLVEEGIPVIDTPASREFSLLPGTTLISEDEAVALMRQDPRRRVYTNSENALAWIAEKLPFTPLPESAARFKDKLSFRRRTSSLFPDLFFRGASLEELQRITPTELPFPLILKPAVGFFSMGVYRIDTPGQWLAVLEKLGRELEEGRGLYPPQVFNSAAFILEELIEGAEYAVDAYYDETGEPIILNIMEHLFSSGADVSDRVYVTSAAIMGENLEEFTAFLRDIGRCVGTASFPIHLELRRREDGVLLPIEVNPLRFGGWCTTADLAATAFAYNPYVCYFRGQRPDWKAILAGREEALYAIVVLDNSTGIPGGEIRGFDWDKLGSRFRRILAVRPVDYRAYPVFGFLFLECRAGDHRELDAILRSDLREFLQ